MALPAQQPEIDTCNACGKLFPRMSMRLCAGCSLVEEHRFQLVREYLQDHDGAAVTEIARGTGVSGSDVRKFMDGGRLIEISGGTVCTCNGIGTRCKYCRSQLSSSFRDMEQKMARDLGSEPPQRRAGDRRLESVDEHGRTSYVRRIRRINEDG